MSRLTLVAAALASALPLSAFAADATPADDLAAMRAEIAAMKQQYESRIAALEDRLSQAEARTDTAPAAEVAATPATTTRSNAFNPDISLILSGRYAHLDNRPTRSITGFLPAGEETGADRGFSLADTELVMSSNIDPYFRGYLAAVLGADDSVALEEAWVATSALDNGLSFKAGRFRSAIGYQNEQHPHAWDFATNNLAYDVLFGEGYGQDGVQLKWLAPTDTFLEFGAELGRGGAYPSTARDTNGFASGALFAHVGDDWDESNSWRAGVSWLTARPQDREWTGFDAADVGVAGAFSGQSHTWLADFVWKWAPEGNPTERNFKFAAEAFQRDETGTLSCDDADPTAPSACTGGVAGDYRSRTRGFYAQGVYQFMRNWRAGYRYDQIYRDRADLNGADAGGLIASLADYDPRRHSLMLDWNPSEFSRWRLQLTRDETQTGVNENQVYLQYIHSLGSHGAHKF